MSALPPKADVAEVGRESPKLTQSGHSAHDAGSSLRRSARMRGTVHARLAGRDRVSGTFKALSRFVVVADVPTGGRTAVERKRVRNIRMLTIDLT